MDIVIVTYGRPHRQVTYDNLPRRWQERAITVVQQREMEHHTNKNIIVLPEHIRNIRDTRHYLIHNCERLTENNIVMLDDDMVFAARREDEPNKFRNMVDEDYDRMFRELSNALLEFAHVGISHREGANRNTDEFVEISRQMRVLAYQKPVLRSLAVKGRTAVMEDFDVTLQLLRHGLPNRLLNNWVHNQGGSNTDGGCSTFRTPVVQTEAAKMLAELHAPFVKVVEKETKTSWGGQKRTDVTVYWKKAYNYGRY
jgi:hypothetical protein